MNTIDCKEKIFYAGQNMMLTEAPYSEFSLTSQCHNLSHVMSVDRRRIEYNLNCYFDVKNCYHFSLQINISYVSMP